MAGVAGAMEGGKMVINTKKPFLYRNGFLKKPLNPKKLIAKLTFCNHELITTQRYLVKTGIYQLSY
jgi:hypothetical protein